MAGSANQPRPDFDDENPALLIAEANQEFRPDEIVGSPLPPAGIDLLEPIAAIRALAETLLSGALNDKKVADQFLTLIIAEADRIAIAAKAMQPSFTPRKGRSRRKQEQTETDEAHVDNTKSI